MDIHNLFLSFNEHEYIGKNKYLIEKLKNDLKKNHEIETTVEENNFIFKFKNKEKRIAISCMYRFSGMCKILKEKQIKGKEKSEHEVIDFTLEMWIFQTMKQCILTLTK